MSCKPSYASSAHRISPSLNVAPKYQVHRSGPQKKPIEGTPYLNRNTLLATRGRELRTNLRSETL